MKYKGFTLIELLIAAVLVAVLTLFATQTYRRVTSDIRWENAKRIADGIAGAAFRFKIEYPNASFSTAVMTANPGSAGECHPYVSSGVTLQTLVDCNFLEGNKDYLPVGFMLQFTTEGYVKVTEIDNSTNTYTATGFN